MTKRELIEALCKFDDDDIVVCKDERGAWDNIIELKQEGCCIDIIFGGGSQFTNE